MKHDLLADMFSIIKNAESIGKKDCIVPASTIIKNVLKIMETQKYISKFDYIEDGKGGKYKVQLAGRINNCNVVKPRFSMKKDEFIKFEKRLLPADNTGLLILTTSQGIMNQHDAKKMNIGGRLLGFVF